MKTATSGITKYQTLEHEYAKFVGARFGVAVNSGTAALHLALVALGVGKGDEVILPDFTMAACAFAVSYTGARPVFVDCGVDLNIDVEKIEKVITKKTKVIMAVHIYGRLCNMKAINRLASKYKLKVIEDACEAQGAPIGPADVTCFSFFKNKIINAEEGGMITTNNKVLHDKMQYLKSMAFGPKHNYWHDDIGYNYRMPELQANLALKSLRQYPRNAKRRRLIEQWYNELLPKSWQMPERDAVWVYDIIPDDVEATKKALSEANITYREFFKPMSAQKPYKRGNRSSRANDYGKRGIYLPVHPSMKKRDVIKICDILCAI